MNDYANPDYCWTHHVVEEPGYLRCGECFHWFPSAVRLVIDHNLSMAMVNSFTDETKANEIYACPHCSHDF